MLANKGYAVFQPNYRGSVDLGRSHWLAGDKKWGYQMQDDIEDGVNALIKKGIADPKKLAMFGWSYGGYAAFTANRYPNAFAKISGTGLAAPSF